MSTSKDRQAHSSSTRMHKSQLFRNDSKLSSATCWGLNKYNGQPCRNTIAPSKAIRYCHKHLDQAQEVSEPLRPNTDDGRTGTQRTTLREAQPVKSAKTRQKTTSEAEVTYPKQKRAVKKQKAPENCRSEGKSSFNFRKLLHHLMCVPLKEPVSRRDNLPSKLSGRNNQSRTTSRTPRAPMTERSSHRKVSDQTQPTSPVVDQHCSTRALCTKHPVHRVGRTTVDSDAQSNTVQTGSPVLVVHDKRILAANFISRYASTAAYPNKSAASLSKLQSIITSCVNGHEQLSAKTCPEFIYVFRLDGDFAPTPLISLKIGRSKDVAARLRQWYTQCRYKIDQLEAYQTDYATLLEKLMHHEFGEDRVFTACRCGRTHREWFAIRRSDARGRIRRALLKWSTFIQEVNALHGP